jgi:hypothetical protein
MVVYAWLGNIKCQQLVEGANSICGTDSYET